jgi:hypothetical protein
MVAHFKFVMAGLVPAISILMAKSFVMLGLSRPKDGVASLAYVPGICVLGHFRNIIARRLELSGNILFHLGS